MFFQCLMCTIVIYSRGYGLPMKRDSSIHLPIISCVFLINLAYLAQPLFCHLFPSNGGHDLLLFIPYPLSSLAFSFKSPKNLGCKVTMPRENKPFSQMQEPKEPAYDAASPALRRAYIYVVGTILHVVYVSYQPCIHTCTHTYIHQMVMTGRYSTLPYTCMQCIPHTDTYITCK
ncbi:hypothetical protein F4820DRAFT_161240 [Hypoxylon rubiginosum]|uniref:Uncharacterized protein n=1 Tax=Hypoxylon rubiginosum TaxID=110542 RepID=A0ACB9Z991_9PEZI|nr:hypothetical protein F4820DRAFT_161240 [Hypoxylon rubiginosum]